MLATDYNKCSVATYLIEADSVLLLRHQRLHAKSTSSCIALKMAALQPKTSQATDEPFVFFTLKQIDVADREEESKIRAAVQMKEDGNKHFVDKNYEKAIEAYDAAIDALNQLDIETCRRELAICHQNRAYVHETLRKYSLVIEDATKAIEIDETYAKAYFRRARAHIVENKIYSAFQDVMWACILQKFKNKVYNQMAIKMNSKFGKLKM